MSVALLIVASTALAWALVVRDVAGIRERPAPRWAARTGMILALATVAGASFLVSMGP